MKILNIPVLFFNVIIYIFLFTSRRLCFGTRLSSSSYFIRYGVFILNPEQFTKALVPLIIYSSLLLLRCGNILLLLYDMQKSSASDGKQNS